MRKGGDRGKGVGRARGWVGQGDGSGKGMGRARGRVGQGDGSDKGLGRARSVVYTHLLSHQTGLELVCRHILSKTYQLHNTSFHVISSFSCCIPLH